MKLSTRVRYGSRALVDLAAHYGGGPQPIKEVARRQEISQHYLEQIIIALKAAGMVKSFRGARGGVALAKPPSQIRVSEVVRVLDGSTAPVECVDDGSRCSRSSTCAMRDVWRDIQRAVDGVLEGKTLQDLVNQQGYGADA